jgi:GABA permease
MPWTTNVLVVAAVTAESTELRDALVERAASRPTAYTLVMPVHDHGAAAHEETAQHLERAVAAAREAGLTMEGVIGDHDPMVAVQDLFDPRRFDAVVVTTLPVDSSRWLNLDLPQRIAKLTGVPVQHVVAAARRRPVGERAPVHEPPHDGILRPLRALPRR